MPTGNSWTMNCVIAGATVCKLIQELKLKEARELLAGLTSELTPNEVDYLLNRVKEASL